MSGADKTEEIVLTISIDTECDHDVNWARSNPLAFDSITEGVPNRLQPAFEAVGAVPTYLLTVEVMEDAPSVEALRNLKGSYEYGTHLHAAFIEPQKKYYRYDGVDSPDFQSSYAPDIEYQKLENLTNLFVEQFGYRPTSFRAGRYGASGDSLNSLQKLGYLVDTSVTPHIRWTEPNGVVDFRAAPEQPYFPVKNGISEAGLCTTGRILEVPVTVKKRLIRRMPLWFRPWFSTVDQMKKVVEHHLRTNQTQRVVSLNMMFHSMEVIEEASPYPQSSADVQRYIDDMQEVLRWCGDKGVTFCGLSTLHEKYYDPVGD